jgi:RNA polymerase sigma-70 factor, ECF subfamily
MDNRSAAHTGGFKLLLIVESLEDRVCRAYEVDRDAVYRYLVSLGTTLADAQDLTQEVFLRMYIAMKQGDEIQTPRAWLFTVASRLALNLRRNHARRASVTDDDRPLDSIATSSLGPELSLLRMDQFTRLRDAIQNLPPQQRVCLRLRAEGFRYRAIGEVMGVAVPTVAEHLRRALTTLRRVINE